MKENSKFICVDLLQLLFSVSHFKYLIISAGNGLGVSLHLGVGSMSSSLISNQTRILLLFELKSAVSMFNRFGVKRGNDFYIPLQ